MAIQDTIKAWPWYGQLILFVVIGAVLFYLGHMQMIAPKKQRIEDLMNQREEIGRASCRERV